MYKRMAVLTEVITKKEKNSRAFVHTIYLTCVIVPVLSLGIDVKINWICSELSLKLQKFVVNWSYCAIFYGLCRKHLLYLKQAETHIQLILRDLKRIFHAPLLFYP